MIFTPKERIIDVNTVKSILLSRPLDFHYKCITGVKRWKNKENCKKM